MIEAGRREPSARVLVRIAKAIGVTPLVVCLLAADETDVPEGRIGVTLLGRIASIADDLWRLSAKSVGNGRNGKQHRRS